MVILYIIFCIAVVMNGFLKKRHTHTPQRKEKKKIRSSLLEWVLPEYLLLSVLKIIPGVVGKTDICLQNNQ